MRKIIQISAVPVPNTSQTQCHAYIFALCDDGTLWFRRDNGDMWQRESDIPQEAPDERV